MNFKTQPYDLRQFRFLQGNINEIIFRRAGFQLIYNYK